MDSLRAVVAVPLAEDLCQLVETLEPRVELVRDHSLLRPMRGTADWSGDPEFVRTPTEQRRFEDMIDSAEALFGIPDVEPRALKRAVEANPDLRWVMTTAAGGAEQVKSAGLRLADLERVIFSTTAGVHVRPLAEFALFGVLAGAKNLPRLTADSGRRTWSGRWEMGQVSEMTVLVVGLGRIGVEVAGMFKELGATVWGSSRSEKVLPGVDRFVELDGLVGAVGDVDAIVVTLPDTKDTYRTIGVDVLEAVRPGVTVVNVGRGSVIDESALLEALADGRVGFAALDVFDVEPLPRESGLWGHPRVIVSPHTAALSRHEEERIARRFAASATSLLDGRSMEAQVTPEALL